MIVTRRSICRMITSMCLSWMSTPCVRYTFCTSRTRCSCTSRGPMTRSTSCGSGRALQQLLADRHVVAVHQQPLGAVDA